MIFFSFFKTLCGKEVTVELKNDLAINGTLHSVDQYMNIKLDNVKVVNEDKFPHMVREAKMLMVYNHSGPVAHRRLQGNGGMAGRPTGSVNCQDRIYVSSKRSKK